MRLLLITFSVIIIGSCNVLSPDKDNGPQVDISDFQHFGDGEFYVKISWDLNGADEITITKKWKATCEGQEETLYESDPRTWEEDFEYTETYQFPQDRRASCSELWVSIEWDGNTTNSKKLDP